MSIKTYKDVSYGPYERNKLDAYIVEGSDKHTPVLIYFHGGGYVSGDKEEILSNPLMQECLDLGITVVTCNYRFITTDPYPAPMEDGTRAIQFIRYIADTWGLDHDKVATAGASAGGHIALWNALKGNLSDPTSMDPVVRMSSKVSSFIGFGTQVSKDQRFYKDIYNGPHIQPNLELFYNISSIEQLYSPEILKLAEEASAINYMSKEAPPAFMVYDYTLDSSEIPADASVNEVIHHPMHGYILKQRYDVHNIPFVLKYKGNPPLTGEMGKFLLDNFDENKIK